MFLRRYILKRHKKDRTRLHKNRQVQRQSRWTKRRDVRTPLLAERLRHSRSLQVQVRRPSRIADLRKDPVLLWRWLRQTQRRLSNPVGYAIYRMSPDIPKVGHRIGLEKQICKDRAIRKAVLFARKVAGLGKKRSPGTSGTYKHTEESRHICH